MAEAELKLLNGVELKLVLADTDVKLQRLLSIYLCPILLKLESQHGSVRQKVLQIVAMLDGRLRENANIMLPLDALLAQYKDPALSSSLKRVALALLRTAQDRSPASMQNFNRLIDGIHAVETSQQQILFQMLFKILRAIDIPTSPSDMTGFVSKHRIIDVADQHCLMIWLSKLMLLHLGAFSGSRQEDTRSLTSQRYMQLVRNALSNAFVPYQGISLHEAKFLAPQGRETFSVTTLNATKLGALKLLSTEIVPANLRYPAVLLATFDLDPSIEKLASDIIRRRCDIDLEDGVLVDRLYDMLSWGRALNEPSTRVSGRDDERQCHPLSPAIRIKIMQLLSKSKMAAIKTDLALAVMLDGFDSADAKLIQATIGFVHWFAKMADLEGLQGSTRPILLHLTNYIAATEASNQPQGFAFIAIGLLASRDVQYTQSHPDLIEHLFKSLSRAQPDTRLAIEEALASCINVFRFAAADALDELREILLNVVTQLPKHTHATAVRFALSSFPFNDVGARFICLLAARSDSKPEITQEASRGLDPHQFRLFNRMSDLTLIESQKQRLQNEQRYALPAFSSLVAWPVQNLERGAILDLQSLNDLSLDIAENFLAFARLVLLSELLPEKQRNAVDENWGRNVDNILLSDRQTRAAVSKSLMQGEPDFSASLARFEELLVHFALQSSKVALNFISELLPLEPALIGLLSVHSGEIQSLSSSSDTAIQAQYCRLRAVLCLDTPDDEANLVIDSMINTLTQPAQSFARQYAAIAFLPFLFVRFALAGRTELVKKHIASVQKGSLSHLDERDSRLVEASLEGLGLLALTGDPPTIDLAAIKKLASKSTDHRIKEAAIVSLGYLSLGYSDSDATRQQLVAFLLDLQDSNAVDTYIATGEALAIAFGGFDTSVVQLKLQVHPEMILPETQSDTLFADTVDEIMATHVRSPKKLCRKAACLWLFTLVQLLKHTTVIKSRLQQLHRAFMSLMGDQDEFVTESASHGIQLIYQQSDQKTKDELVTSLMGTFASDSAAKAASGNVGLSSESELFAPGTMTVGENNSVSTYKDICDLAVDMGNNELVYQFMSLASSASIWSTRRGSALGLSSILSMTGSENILASNPTMLKRLVPRLYRYKHDPSKTVAKTMNDIFAQICPDEKVALKEQFDDIMRELLKGLTDRAWRTREASCGALISLLLGRNLNEVEQYTDQLWQASFRALDDVKESVRVAALGLCKALTKLVIKGVSGEGKSSSAMLDAALPIFLRNLKSPSVEVSSFSLETLLKLVKASGRAIQPYLATLVEEFMLLTTNMEPEMLNYLSFHASKYNVTQTQLDEARLASMRSNPIMAALEDCVDQLTERSAPETIARLSGIIRQTNGLPTKAACARFIISACSRKPHLVKPEADSLIQALSGCLTDASETTRAAYAASVGYVARLCEPTKLLKLIAFLSKSFFKASEQDLSDALPLVLSTVSQNAMDRFQALATSFIPLVFLGLHEQDEHVKMLFDQVWQRCVTSKPAAVRLYLPEILSLCETHLVSPVWRVKQLAARSLAEAAGAVDLNEVDFERVFALVLAALGGRSWKGKEQVLQALVTLAKSRSEKMPAEKLAQANAAVLKEFRRTGPEYKRHALTAMTTYLKSMPQVQLFKEIAETVVPFLRQNASTGKDADGDDEMVDLDDLDEKERGPLRLVIIQGSIACLLSAVRVDGPQGPQQLATCAEVLKHVKAQNYPWNVTLQMLESITELFQRLEIQKSAVDMASIGQFWSIVAEVAVDQSYMTLREQAVKAAASVFALASKEGCDADLALVKADIAKFRATESSPPIQAAWEKLESLYK